MTMLRFAALCLFLMLTHLPAQAQAQGASCASLSPQQQRTTWWGRFSGGREINWSFDNEGIEYHTEEACFATRKACERWLYELKSDFGYMPRWNECSNGYQPGKPVRRP